MNILNSLKQKFKEIFLEEGQTKIECGILETKITSLIKNNNIKGLKEHLDNMDTNLEDIFLSTKYSALSQAISLSKTEMVKLLISYNADVNVKDVFKVTPLMKASALGNLNIIEILIENKADVNLKDCDSMNAIDYAEFYENYDIAEYLKNYL